MNNSAQASGEGATCNQNSTLVENEISSRVDKDLFYIKGSMVFAGPLIPSAFSIGELVTIGHDGKLTYGAGYSPDAAAELFWQTMAHRAPGIFDEMLLALKSVARDPLDVVLAKQVNNAIAKAEGKST